MSDLASSTSTTSCATCSSSGWLALVPEGDSAASEVVGRDFEGYPVAGEHADAEPSHFPRDGCMNLVSVAYKDAESCVRQDLGHSSFELDCFFFCHRSPCSN